MNVVIDGNKLLKRFEDSNGDFYEESFDKEDSLLHFLKQPVIFRDNTSLENILWSFLNDRNSKSLFQSLNKVLGCDSLEKYFRKRLNSGSEGILRNNIDWIEFTPNPIKGVFDDCNIEKRDNNSGKSWNLTGLKREDGYVKSVNISAFPLAKLLDVPVKINTIKPIYDIDWNHRGVCGDLPFVLDILEAVCYEFYYYRDRGEINEKKDMVTLKQLLEKRRN